MASRTEKENQSVSWSGYHPFDSTTDESTSFAAENARSAASAIAKELKSRFNASKVVLFGSLARGDFHRWSDIDIAVSGIPPAEYYRAVAFASGFSDRFKVDLVDVADCPESLRHQIEEEGVEL